MWTPTTREQHSRKALRYQTDLTAAEWVVIEPHLPPAHGTGRPRSWPMREIVNGIFYVMRAGCPWRLLPSDLPPWGTIYRWFAKFRDDGLLEKINHSLVMADRERVGREARQSGAIIDSQSVTTTEAGGPRGYDAGKKVKGRKRHALVDTDGRGLVLEAQPASIQDRDGGGPLLCASQRLVSVHRRQLVQTVRSLAAPRRPEIVLPVGWSRVVREHARISRIGPRGVGEVFGNPGEVAHRLDTGHRVLVDWLGKGPCRVRVVVCYPPNDPIGRRQVCHPARHRGGIVAVEYKRCER